MKKLEARLQALEQRKDDTPAQLPFVVPDCTNDEGIERIARTGRKVFRASDPRLFDEFIV